MRNSEINVEGRRRRCNTEGRKLVRHEGYIRMTTWNIRRRNDQTLRRRYPPIVETFLQAVAEANRAERIGQTANSSVQTSSNLVVIEDADPRGEQSSSRRRFSQARRQRRRRRNRARRLPDLSAPHQPTEYEVPEVYYQEITDIGNVVPPKDWKIIPKYKLSPKEIEQQERELYYSMTKDSLPEETRKAQDEDPTCCVCTDNMATRVVIPCGHRCLCRECAYKIATSRSIFQDRKLPKLCPICRAAIAVMTMLC